MGLRILSFLTVLFAVLIRIRGQEVMSQVLKETAGYITFNSLLRKANLTDCLDKGTYIVFGISDSGFSSMGQASIDRLFDINHRAEMTNRMKNHIIPWTHGAIPTVWSGEALPTLGNSTLRPVSYLRHKISIVNGIVFRDPGLNVTNGKLFSVAQTLDVPSGQDIYSLLLHARTYNSFLTAVNLAGMDDELRADNITVFAPSDHAFKVLQQGQRDRIFDSIERAMNLVKLHIVKGIYYMKGVRTNDALRTLSPYMHTIHMRARGPTRWTYPGGTVSTQDWLASNGVIQGVENIIVPARFHHVRWG